MGSARAALLLRGFKVGCLLHNAHISFKLSSRIEGRRKEPLITHVTIAPLFTPAGWHAFTAASKYLHSGFHEEKHMNCCSGAIIGFHYYMYESAFLSRRQDVQVFFSLLCTREHSGLVQRRRKVVGWLRSAPRLKHCAFKTSNQLRAISGLWLC